MKKFLKSTDVHLVNGGYLSTKEGDSPVTNEAFVAAQKHAEYIMTFAEHAKGKDFKGKEADNLSDVKKAVAEALATKQREYISKPKKVTKKLSEQLADEALAFMKFEETSSKVDKINNFLQQFNVLSEFEEFGLFFEDGIVKLNNIYSMKEIVKAVEETIDLLD